MLIFIHGDHNVKHTSISSTALAHTSVLRNRFESGCKPSFRIGVVGNISACHADAPGSIPGFGVFIPRFTAYIV